MLSETMETLASHGMPVQMNSIRMLISRANEQKAAQTRIIQMMRQTYGTNLCNCCTFRNSAEIDNASSLLMTVFELEAPTSSHETYKRCINQLNVMVDEIELLVRKHWPSYTDRLIEKAKS